MRAAVAILSTILVLTAAWPPSVAAQGSAGGRRIAVLWPVSRDANLEAFRQGLRELGHVEGQNILIDYRYANGRDELLPELATELVRLNAEIIVTWGVTAARAIRRATTTTPIVNGSMSDPVAAGLAKSLARPDGNVTGLTSMSPGLSAKRLALVKDALPGTTRVGVLTTASPTAKLALQEIEMAARSLGLALHAVQVREPGQFDTALSAMVRERATALVVLPDLLFHQHIKKLVELAARHRLPTTHWSRDYVEAGGLMSYAASLSDMFRRAAGYVDRILKGSTPADLPIEQPTKFELVINMKTARALGVTFPPSFLLRADELVD